MSCDQMELHSITCPMTARHKTYAFSLITRARIHNAVVSTSPGLKSTYARLAI